MQTIGTTLIAIKRYILVRMWMPAQGSRSLHGLLYRAAVYSTTGTSLKSFDIGYSNMISNALPDRRAGCRSPRVGCLKASAGAD
jgi:hypothetical protein